VQLFVGDCLDVLAGMETASADAIVTDPPAAVSFMGREWDSDMGGRAQWVAWLSERMAQAVRVLRPGGHALVWSLPRTAHWTAWALEDAGLEIRDCIPHLFGSGFPKSLDVGKAIDKRRDWTLTERLADEIRRARAEAGASLADIGRQMQQATDGMYGKWYHRGGHMFFETGRSLPSRPEWEHLRRHLPIRDQFQEAYAEAEREVIGMRRRSGAPPQPMWDADAGQEWAETAPATEDAARWDGWGTALKPGQELWWLARKPIRGTVAASVLEHGTGALNIDGCRVGPGGQLRWASPRDMGYHGGTDNGPVEALESAAGRWPPNLVLTHSAACGTQCAGDCPVGELDRQSGKVTTPNKGVRGRGSEIYASGKGFANTLATVGQEVGYGDIGGASRFYPTFRYQAKAPAAERPRLDDGTAHPTVKPLGLICWLARLITPPGGTILDLFAGTGVTAEAAIIEGFRCILIEADPASAELIRIRLRKDIQPAMFA
jgi:site-specific DNA-methyltransferase (adenine-specific)